MSSIEERDDVDRLFAELASAELPDDFMGRVMARARAGEVARWSPRQRVAFGVLYVAALLGLGVLAYLLGTELEQTHTRELIQLALQDLSTVKESPGVYISALSESIPWAHLAALLADLVLLAVATRMLLKSATQAGRPDSSKPAAA